MADRQRYRRLINHLLRAHEILRMCRDDESLDAINAGQLTEVAIDLGGIIDRIAAEGYDYTDA